MIQHVGVERAGPKVPVVSGIPRAPASVRRTSTTDSWRPNGLEGDVEVTARARDLLTPAAGPAEVLGLAGFEAVLAGDRVLAAFDHPDERLGALVGIRVAGGFRARIPELVPEELEARTPLHLLLDDLPGACLVAGYAMQRHDSWYQRRMPIEVLSGSVDLCAGWASEASILEAVRTYENIPVPTIATVPPEPEDALAWHERPALPAGATRRARRLDLVADTDPSGPSDPTFRIDAHFRDSYREADGSEGALHEYGVRGRYDPATRTIVALETTAHVLPWTECPQAVASGRRIVGTTVDDLRTRVRAELVGTSTCTHLNDLLRSLADLPAMARPLLDALDENAGPDANHSRGR